MYPGKIDKHSMFIIALFTFCHSRFNKVFPKVSDFICLNFSCWEILTFIDFIQKIPYIFLQKYVHMCFWKCQHNLIETKIIFDCGCISDIFIFSFYVSTRIIVISTRKTSTELADDYSLHIFFKIIQIINFICSMNAYR